MRLLLAKDVLAHLTIRVVIGLRRDRKWFIESQISLKQNSTATLRSPCAGPSQGPVQGAGSSGPCTLRNILDETLRVLESESSALRVARRVCAHLSPMLSVTKFLYARRALPSMTGEGMTHEANSEFECALSLSTLLGSRCPCLSAELANGETRRGEGAAAALDGRLRRLPGGGPGIKH